MENDFKNFIPDVHNDIFKNEYDFNLVYFNKNINDGIEEYKRRIERFNNIINNKDKIYFIYINEDYFHDEEYRKSVDTNFKEMLDLELFLKSKYVNIDFNILYFDFKEHIIPLNSNIINIVLQTSKLYDSYENCPLLDFRKYCGRILSEIF